MLLIGTDWPGLSNRPFEVRILSPFVRRLFEEVVPRYPQITYASAYIAMPRPYDPMFHHFDEMKARAKDILPKDGENAEDFEVLEKWYSKNLKANFDLIRGNIRHGLVRFEDLWAIFRPQSLLQCRDPFNEPQLNVVIDSRVERSAWHFENVDVCYVEFWWVQWDRAAQVFTRYYRAESIKGFDGTRKILSLPVYPLNHSSQIDTTDNNSDILNHVRSRGEQYRQLVSVSSTCMYHRGNARNFLGSRGYTFFEGKVIIDQEMQMDVDPEKPFGSRREREEPQPMKDTSKDDMLNGINGR